MVSNNITSEVKELSPSSILFSNVLNPVILFDFVVNASSFLKYLRGADPKALTEVADKNWVCLGSIFGSKMKSHNRMGSSVIDEISGMAVTNILVELFLWPVYFQNKNIDSDCDLIGNEDIPLTINVKRNSSSSKK